MKRSARDHFVGAEMIHPELFKTAQPDRRWIIGIGANLSYGEAEDMFNFEIDGITGRAKVESEISKDVRHCPLQSYSVNGQMSAGPATGPGYFYGRTC